MSYNLCFINFFVWPTYKLKRWLKSRWVVQKALRWNVLFLFDAHAVLFTLYLLSGFFYKSGYQTTMLQFVWTVFTQVFLRPIRRKDVWGEAAATNWLKLRKFTLVFDKGFYLNSGMYKKHTHRSCTIKVKDREHHSFMMA